MLPSPVLVPNAKNQVELDIKPQVVEKQFTKLTSNASTLVSNEITDLKLFSVTDDGSIQSINYFL